MNKVFQTKRGTEGNCFSACLASMYGGTIEDWQGASNANPDWKQWLREAHGLSCIEILWKEIESLTLEPDEFYMLGVVSASGLNHVVVGRYLVEESEDQKRIVFQVVHDPLHVDPDFDRYEGIRTILLFYKPSLA